jgi:parallel beta-helix repeat protein
MKHIRSSIYGLFAVLTLGFLLSSPEALAETTQCTAITSLPTTISTQGIHCLTGNLATNLASGNAIEITVNNVTIDMNGFKLGNLAAGSGTEARGIFAFQKKNITIRNGIIRGFLHGIWLKDDFPFTTSSGHLIEDIRADGNTQVGLLVNGTGNVVRNNQVVNTGGTTVSSDAGGIVVEGPGTRVINNDVTGTAASSGDSFGFFMDNANNSVVEGNRVSNTSADSGASTGIYIVDSSNAMVVNNRIATADNGVFYSSAGGGSTGKYRDNITDGIAAAAYTGGTDIGNNN